MAAQSTCGYSSEKCLAHLLPLNIFLLPVEGERDLLAAHGGGSSLSNYRRVWPSRQGKYCWRRHEVFKECVGTGCEEGTCWKPTIGPRCFRNCKSGCYCGKGYYRNHRDQCVTWTTCLKQMYPWAYEYYAFDQTRGGH
ncbi:uncharacterized protein LOC142589779 [Dermacentor variabilis]|uniref:uncharacterized protein LOC142589779 n=1 Tax=Dermacentor variabilis TaxID=34621 RepID=UPI003F5BC9C7